MQKLRDAASESDESNKIQKTKHRCIVEAHESTRNRLESTLPKDHEDHIAEKRFKSISHYNLVHKFIPTPRRCENSRCESRSGQGKEEAPNIASLAIRQGEEQKGGYSVSTMREKENPLCYIDGHLSSQECGVGTEVPEVYRGRVVLRGDIVKDDSDKSSKKPSARQPPKAKSKTEAILEAQREDKIYFATLMDMFHLKKAVLEPKLEKCEGQAALRGDTVEDDSGSFSVFFEQGSSASQLTAAKVMGVIARLLDCAGQAAHAAPVYTQVPQVPNG